jgi:hypothetical protein
MPSNKTNQLAGSDLYIFSEPTIVMTLKAAPQQCFGVGLGREREVEPRGFEALNATD